MTLGLFLGCAHNDVQPDRQRRHHQLAALKQFSEWETAVLSFCRAQQEINQAEVYIRENQAVILLVSSPDLAIQPETIRRINHFVMDSTGFAGEQIVIKQKY